MTRTHRISITLLIAGAIAAIIGFVVNPSIGSSDASAEAERSTSAGIDPVTGLAPIERIVPFWQERVDRSPSDYLSRTQLGFAVLTDAREHADLDRFADAELVFAEALERNEHHDAARLGLAQAVHAQHRFADALVLVESVLEREPDSVPAMLLAADARWELGQHGDAAAVYADILERERTAPVLSRMAKVADLRLDHVAAVNLAAEALEIAQRTPQRSHTAAFHHFQLAHFLERAGDVERALEQLDLALAHDANHVGSVELRAGLELDAGNLTVAAEAYAHLLEIAPAADLHGAFADVQRLLGNEELAAEHEAIAYEMAWETIESQPAERRHVAEFFLTRDPAVARELALVELDERDDVGAWELLSRSEAALGNAEAAEAARNEADVRRMFAD